MACFVTASEMSPAYVGVCPHPDGLTMAEPEQATEELMEQLAGDIVRVSWGADKHVIAQIFYDLDTPTGLAIGVELSNGSCFDVMTGGNLDAVTLEMPRGDAGDSVSGARVEIPELVLGSPFDLISEDAADEEVQSLMSETYACVNGGPFVRACVSSYFGDLVLEVELPDAPVFIFRVNEGIHSALALRVAQDARRPEGSKGQVVYVEVPNGFLGDIREAISAVDPRMTASATR